MKKKYVKPEVKVINVDSEDETMHSSNWYNRQDHGYRHKNHDDQGDNGNHNGWCNLNNLHSGWDD